MKYLVLSLISSVALMSPKAAHAFITSEEQTQLLSSMNKLNSAQVYFEDIRCSQRNRMCLVRMELGAQKLKVGCSIEQIASSADLFTGDEVTGLELSEYSRNAIEQCIAGFTK